LQDVFIIYDYDLNCHRVTLKFISSIMSKFVSHIVI